MFNPEESLADLEPFSSTEDNEDLHGYMQELSSLFDAHPRQVKPQLPKHADRFVPTRVDLEALLQDKEAPRPSSYKYRYYDSSRVSLVSQKKKASLPELTPHSKMLKEMLLGEEPSSLLFNSKPRDIEESEMPVLRNSFFQGSIPLRTKKAPTSSSTITHQFQQMKIFSAPDIPMDFYSNLLSWSGEGQFFTVLGAEQGFALYCAKLNRSFDIDQIFSFSIHDSVPCRVKSFGSSHVLTGWRDSGIFMYDASATSSLPIQRFQMLEVADHTSTGVTDISIIDANSFVAMSPDGGIDVFDKRQAGPTMHKNLLMQADLFSTVERSALMAIAHNQEQTYVTPTRNGYMLSWDMRVFSGPARLLDDSYHARSSFKAIAFHPFNNNLLISGGGVSCRDIVLRIIEDNRCLAKYSTSHQITGIAWLNASQIVVSLGYERHDAGAGLLLLEKDRHNRLRLIGSYFSEPDKRFLYMDVCNHKVILNSSNENIQIFNIETKQREYSYTDEIKHSLHEYALTMR